MAGVIGPAEGTKPRKVLQHKKIASFQVWKEAILLAIDCFYTLRKSLHTTQLRLAVRMVTDFVSSIHNLKAVL